MLVYELWGRHSEGISLKDVFIQLQNIQLKGLFYLSIIFFYWNAHKELEVNEALKYTTFSVKIIVEPFFYFILMNY